MYEYEKVLDDYKNEYIYAKGQKKYNSLVEKVHNSTTLKSSINHSINNHPLSAGDYKIISASSTSFFAGPAADIMAQLTAFEIWQNKCNAHFQWLNEFELLNLVNSITRSFGRQIL